MVLNLDLDVHAGGEIELHQRVHRLRGRLHDVEQAEMGPHLELLAALLIDVRGAVDREPLDMSRQRDRSANPSTRTASRVDDLLSAVVQHAVIIGPKADANILVVHRSLLSNPRRNENRRPPPQKGAGAGWRFVATA